MGRHNGGFSGGNAHLTAIAGGMARYDRALPDFSAQLRHRGYTDIFIKTLSKLSG
ncbi:MAG: hypothetical protein AAFN08_03330 [Cyanobacteria bacterium J06559_3]